MSRTSSQPTVSVIIPCFNCECYIEDTIKSVLLQSYPISQLICIDDCSTDSTFDILNSIECPFLEVYRTDDPSGGPALPRNIGISKSHSDLIAFCDSDDLWMTDKILVQVRVYQALSVTFASSIVVSSRKIDFVSDCNISSLRIMASNPSRYLVEQVSLRANPIVTSSVLLPSVLNPYFSQNPSLVAVEDYFLWLNLASRHVSFFRVDCALVFYRINSSSISSSKIKQLNRLYALFLNRFVALGYTGLLLQVAISLRLAFFLFFHLPVSFTSRFNRS